MDLLVEVCPRINLALASSVHPVVSRLAVRNTSGDDADGLTIAMRSVPGLVRDRQWFLDRVPAGSLVAVSDPEVSFDLEAFLALNEAQSGELVFEVRSAGEVCASSRVGVDFLCRDEWSGLGAGPGLVASFVAPNDPEIAPILKRASGLMASAGLPAGIDGYQSRDPARAFVLGGAIWSALTGLGLSYAEPPASFECTGQKVRSPARIMRERLATCLDSALLLAAALEAAGLSPAVLFRTGHAWTGFWLVPDGTFGVVAEPDVVAVRKAVRGGEFVVLESTLLTRRPAPGLEAAFKAGRELLSEAHETGFSLCVDVSRARTVGIRPLPVPGESPRDCSGAGGEPAEPAPLPQVPDLDPMLVPDVHEPDEADEPATVLGRWQRKLLDLTLRNRLLNHREGRLGLALQCPDTGALLDDLAQGRRLGFQALRDGDLFAAPPLADDRVQGAYAKRRLGVDLDPDKCDERLLGLYRRSMSDRHEGGSNTLFVAAGSLRWRRPGVDRSYRAPLVLVPVRLERASAKAVFRLVRHDDEPRVNETLLEFLRRDFDLRVPEFVGGVPASGSSVMLHSVLDAMRRRVRDIPGSRSWRRSRSRCTRLPSTSCGRTWSSSRRRFAPARSCAC